jgi:hypothetical protein
LVFAPNRLEDEDEEDEEQAGPSTGVHPASTTRQSDDDPDGPNQTHHDPDKFGWTRSLSRVAVQAFQGPTPHGPTFEVLDEPVKYFFKFFPNLLLCSIADWTNQKLRAAQKAMTSAHEIRAWLGIHFVMARPLKDSLLSGLLVLRTRIQESPD